MALKLKVGAIWSTFGIFRSIFLPQTESFSFGQWWPLIEGVVLSKITTSKGGLKIEFYCSMTHFWSFLILFSAPNRAFNFWAIRAANTANRRSHFSKKYHFIMLPQNLKILGFSSFLEIFNPFFCPTPSLLDLGYMGRQ